MKKLITCLALGLALFAGNLTSVSAAEDNSTAEPTPVFSDVTNDKGEVPQKGSGDSGDTAWMTTAAILVLFITIPGLSLFYGGLVRSKNYLSILVQCFAITCVMSFLWIAYGYGWSAEGGGKFFGDFSNRVFLDGYTPENMSDPADTIP